MFPPGLVRVSVPVPSTGEYGEYDGGGSSGGSGGGGGNSRGGSGAGSGSGSSDDGGGDGGDTGGGSGGGDGSGGLSLGGVLSLATQFVNLAVQGLEPLFDQSRRLFGRHEKVIKAQIKQIDEKYSTILSELEEQKQVSIKCCTQAHQHDHQLVLAT